MRTTAWGLLCISKQRTKSFFIYAISQDTYRYFYLTGDLWNTYSVFYVRFRRVRGLSGLNYGARQTRCSSWGETRRPIKTEKKPDAVGQNQQAPLCRLVKGRGGIPAGFCTVDLSWVYLPACLFCNLGDFSVYP